MAKVKATTGIIGKTKKKAKPKKKAKAKLPSGGQTKWTAKTLGLIEKYINDYQSLGHIIPSMVGLAEYLDVTSRCIQKWRKDEKKVGLVRTLEKLEDRQHRILLESGLKGSFNSTITKLALHNHGYSEKVEQTNLDGGEAPSLDDYYTD